MIENFEDLTIIIIYYFSVPKLKECITIEKIEAEFRIFEVF